MRTVTCLADGNIQIHIEHQIKKVSSRKRVIIPYTNRATRCTQDLIKAIMRSLKWREALECNAFSSINDFAAQEKMDKAYFYRFLNLSFLSPTIIEKIIEGDLPEEVSIHKMFKIAREPLWHKQHELLGI